MGLGELTVRHLLEELAAPTPTPAGGAAAALAGAMGAALTALVARLADDAGSPALRQAEALRGRLVALADADVAAYAALLAARRLTRDTPHRAAAVQTALQAATDAPLDVAAACLGVLELVAGLAGRCSRPLAGDAAAAARLAHAGLAASLGNVRGNLRAVGDAAYRADAAARAAALHTRAAAVLTQALAAADHQE